jgi:hypothetical protein
VTIYPNPTIGDHESVIDRTLAPLEGVGLGRCGFYSALYE